MQLLACSSGLMVDLQRDTSSFRLKKSISLQRVGFTIFARHRAKLWALTPLFSPLPL